MSIKEKKGPNFKKLRSILSIICCVILNLCSTALLAFSIKKGIVRLIPWKPLGEFIYFIIWQLGLFLIFVDTKQSIKDLKEKTPNKE